MGSVDPLSLSDMSSQSQSSRTLNFQHATTTTISTIALQSGETRLVIAVLQSGQFINLRILEMSPSLAKIERNTENSEEALRKHEEVQEKLRNKQSPVQELMEQGVVKVDARRNPEVFMAMTESLGSAWRDVNSTLDLRRKILQKAFEFHKNRTICIEYFVQLCQNKKEVLVFYRYAVEDGRRLIEKLKEAAKEEPEEAAYAIGLVNIWLDELQERRFKWQDSLKVMTKKDQQKLTEAGFERIIQEIQEEFKIGHNHDDLRNRLLHLSANLDKSDVAESKKSQLQRIVYNLIERITIIMELEEEIRIFIQTHRDLDVENFGELYEEKLQVIKEFELQSIEELQTTLEKRLEARKNYDVILANPLDYDYDQVEKLLNVDSNLDVSSALRRIKLARENSMSGKSIGYLEKQIQEVKAEITNLSPGDDVGIRKLKEKVENMSAIIPKAPLLEEQERSSLIHQCQEFIHQLNAAAGVDKFLKGNNVLDADGFEKKYSSILSSDLFELAPSQFKQCLVTRLEIRQKYDTMLDNPTAFSEGHIQTICNWDPTLDTAGAYEKLRLLCLRSKGVDMTGDGDLKVNVVEPDQTQRNHPNVDEQWQREIEEQIQQETQEAIEWQFKESERQQELERRAESAKLVELERQKEAEQKRQLEELEWRQQLEELEQKRLQEELARQQEQEEIDQKRQQEELARQQEQEEINWKRQALELQRQQELERKRQEDFERKRQQEELERKRQQEELERIRQEMELQRQGEFERKRQEDLERKRQEDLERKRQEELERKRQEELERKRQEELERNRQEELERKRQEDLERKRQQEELEWKRQQEELERIRQEMELQRQGEFEQKRQEDLERKRQEDLERKRQEDLERKRQEELERKRQEDLERKRQEELERKRQEDLERKRQEELERKRQEELERNRQEELERKRQEDLERKRQQEELEWKRQQEDLERIRQEMDLQRQEEFERKRQQEELDRKRQAELEQKREEEEIIRRTALALEAQQLKEQHLDELIKTLDFSLPENLKTARNDLKDFHKFEAIVEEIDNPPLELIEKMYEKKNKIIQCLQFYELIQKHDRLLYIREIRKLEYELFQVTTISEEIENEPRLYSSRIQTEIQPAEAVVQTTMTGDAMEEALLKYGNTSPSGDFFGSMSDNEVQAIFEQSTMQTQTAERDARILANCETQTQRIESPEPVVILMQEPAKILSTMQTQTPSLPEKVHEIPTSSASLEQTPTRIPEISGEHPYSHQCEELRPESPAKLLLTSETQTAESALPEFVSKENIYIHKQSEMILEKHGVELLPKFVSDSDTQTHEPSPQFFCNSSAQTKITGKTQELIVPAVVHFQSQEKDTEGVLVFATTGKEQISDTSKRRPSVSEMIASLNTRIKQDITEASILDTRRSPVPGKNEKLKLNPPGDLNSSDLSITTPGKSLVTSHKRMFEKYEEEVTTRVECPPETSFGVHQGLETDIGEVPPSEPSTLPRRKVKDFKKIFEQPLSPPQLEIHNKPRNVPILVEFPAKRKVGEYRQLFENIECPSPPPLPAYQVSSIRHSSKYNASNRNYESNYTEHVSCHGVDNPVSPPCSPYVTFQDSRPGSSASDYYGMRRPTKFVPAKFTESDYESDYEAFKIEPIWVPPSSKARPMSAYEFRPASRGNQWEDFRPKSSTFVKPELPLKPANLAKPIAIKKPIPPPKPTNKHQADKIFTDHIMFNVAEPISDTLQRHKQLTSTLTKSEECKFFLRPVASPVEADEELRVVRKSMSPTHYTSVTSSPVHFHRVKPEQYKQVGKVYNKETFREERTWKSFDRMTPNALEYAHHLNQLESTSDFSSTRPKSTEFRQTISSEGTGRPKSLDVYHAFRNDSYEEVEPEPKERVHKIRIIE